MLERGDPAPPRCRRHPGSSANRWSTDVQYQRSLLYWKGAQGGIAYSDIMSTHSPDPPVGSDPANGRPSSDPPPPPANADRLATTPAAAAGPTAPIVIRPGAPGLPPMFLDRSAQFAVQGQQRASLSSMLFMTFVSRDFQSTELQVISSPTFDLLLCSLVLLHDVKQR